MNMKNKKNICILIITVFTFFINLQVFSQHWVPAGTVPNPGLTPSISVVDANIAWIAGGTVNNPLIYRTSNGGANWTQITTNGTTNELHCIWAVSSTSAIVGEGAINSYARLYKFSSDGSKWNVVLETGMNDGAFNNLIFSRSNPLLGGALADEIYITTNGGNNWVLKTTGVVGVSSAQNSLMMIDENFFGFGLKNGAARVRMTSDGGNTWSTKNISLIGTYTSGFTFKSDKLIGISSTSLSMPHIARTSDGGNTWTAIDIGAGLSGTTIIKWVPGTNVVYILGSNGAVKRSTNNGLNWVSLETAGITGLNHFDFNKVNNIICGYAVSTNGSVIKLADSVLILTNTNPVTSEIPSEFRLHQNYPNPFNPTTNIKYEIPDNRFVSLKVYNILGIEVATLVDQFQKAGVYEVPFSKNLISSGVYFYKIESGSFTDLKRMMLIK
jgi:photosystem II stability/assembly factor-like uncharacterized protein